MIEVEVKFYMPPVTKSVILETLWIFGLHSVFFLQIFVIHIVNLVLLGNNSVPSNKKNAVCQYFLSGSPLWIVKLILVAVVEGVAVWMQ